MVIGTRFRDDDEDDDDGEAAMMQLARYYTGKKGHLTVPRTS